jgi:hypothetical protein
MHQGGRTKVSSNPLDISIFLVDSELSTYEIG